MNLFNIPCGSFSYCAFGFFRSTLSLAVFITLGASNVIISPLLGISLIVLTHLFNHSLSFSFKVGVIDVCCTIVGVPI